MKRKIFEAGRILLEAVLIAALTLLGVVPFSCKVSAEGIEIIGGDYTAPVIEAVNVIDEETVIMEFSDSVKMSNVVVSPCIPGISDSSKHSQTEDLSPSLAAASGLYGKLPVQVSSSEDFKSITFNLGEKTKIGKGYEIFGTVEDKIGNTLTFCVPFTGFNSHFPKMIITEVLIKYGKGSSNGQTIYRGEYVELMVIEGGNLAGLEIFSAADGDSKKYSFPPIEVSKGEILLVHLRTIGDGCISEEGDDLDLATAPHSRNGIRDLWLDTSLAHFNDSSDVILLRNSVDNTIIDGLMYAADEATEWKASVAEYAQVLVDAGIYSSPDISGASSSKGCTPQKSLTRDEMDVLYNRIVDGEEIELPLISDEDSWIVVPASPGLI